MKYPQNKLFIAIVFSTMMLFLPTMVLGQKPQLTQKEIKRWEKYTQKNITYISAYWGHGSYSMDGIRDLQARMIRSIGIDAQVNSDFPPYWLYGIALARKYDDARFGINVENMSTGARSSISDYSGLFYSDVICKGTKFGVFLEKDKWQFFSPKNKFIAGYRLEAGALHSNINIKNYALLYDMPNPRIDNNSTLETATMYIEPALYASYYLSKQTYLQLSAGFMISIPVKVEFYSNYIPNNYTVSWDGYRIRLAIVEQF